MSTIYTETQKENRLTIQYRSLYRIINPIEATYIYIPIYRLLITDISRSRAIIDDLIGAIIDQKLNYSLAARALLYNRDISRYIPHRSYIYITWLHRVKRRGRVCAIAESRQDARRGRVVFMYTCVWVYRFVVFLFFCEYKWRVSVCV